MPGIDGERVAARGGVVPGPPELLPGRPDAVVDLRTAAGANLVGARWRFTPVRLREVDFVDVGPDLGPGAEPNRTYDIDPGYAGLDTAEGVDLEPADLARRLSTGKVCFCWYRTTVTLPGRLGDLDVAGATVVFEVVIDDYAEVWVNGVLAPVLGARGGAVVAGFNTPNRVVLTADARPGQRFDLAVFGINGPISLAPSNYIWVRTATLDLYSAGTARPAQDVPVRLDHVTTGVERIVAAPVRAERVASGFTAPDGPVWTRDGSLLFSSPATNVIYRWSPVGTVEVFRSKSGYSGVDIGRFALPGSAGLTFDLQGRLIICELGRRAVVRIEPHGNVTVLADRHRERRLGSPWDVVVRSDGAVFFTDPALGPDAGRERATAAVIAVVDGDVRLVIDDLAAPKGLAFSPDERHLYVGGRSTGRPVVMRYAVDASCAVTGGEVLVDLSDAPGRTTTDAPATDAPATDAAIAHTSVTDTTVTDTAVTAVVVDAEGHLYVCGPGGIWLVAPDGRRLGLLRLPENPHNLAWGDPGETGDARTLYVTATSGIYRIRLDIPGIRPR